MQEPGRKAGFLCCCSVYSCETVMMPEQNKDIIRCFFDELVNKGNHNLTDRFINANFVAHDPNFPEDLQGPEGFTRVLKEVRRAFSEIFFEIDYVIAEGNFVACRWIAQGLHRKEFLGLPPAAKLVLISGLFLFRFSEAQIVELWIGWSPRELERQAEVRVEQEAALV